MADIRLTRQQTAGNVHRSSADQYRALAGTADGAAYTVDWFTALALEGRMYGLNVGTLSTPVAGHVGIDDDQPEAVLDVPSGTTIIPVSIDLYLEDSAGTDTEVVFLTSQANVGAGTSTELSTIRNLRADAPLTSSCTAYRSYTGNGTATSAGFEFYRSGYPFADATTDPVKKFHWSAKESGIVPVIVGDGALVLYWAGTTTAPSGFAQIVYVEVPSTSITQ